MKIQLRVSHVFLAACIAFLPASVMAGKGPSVKNVEGATTVDVKQAKELWLQGAAFIDTRKGSDWDAGRIPGAFHFNVKKPEEFNPENIGRFIDKNTPVVSYCNAEMCHRASKGAKKLVSFGFTKVYYYRDGFPSWKNANNPYE